MPPQEMLGIRSIDAQKVNLQFRVSQMYNNKTILRSTFHFRKPGLPQTGAARKPENIHQTHYTHLYLCFTFELKPTPETNSKYDVIKMHNYET